MTERPMINDDQKEDQIEIEEKQEKSIEKSLDDTEREKQLTKLIESESTNFQWSKLSINFGMLAIMTIIQLLRGPDSKPSIIGVNRCDNLDFILQTNFGIFPLCGSCRNSIAV